RADNLQRSGIHWTESCHFPPVDRRFLPARLVLRTICNLCTLSCFPLRRKLYFHSGYDSLHALSLLLGKSGTSRQSIVRLSAPRAGQCASNGSSYSYYFNFYHVEVQ